MKNYALFTRKAKSYIVDSCAILQFFFVMRKKYDQVTTLHVIHHGIMPLSVWFGVKFTPGKNFEAFFAQKKTERKLTKSVSLFAGGHSTFFGLLNTFVHIIMYTYYMLAAMGPQMQRYLWWKRYLTALQMVIFCYRIPFQHNHLTGRI